MGCDAEIIINFNAGKPEIVGFNLETDCENCSRIRERIAKHNQDVKEMDEWMQQRVDMIENDRRRAEERKLKNFEDDFFNVKDPAKWRWA